MGKSSERDTATRRDFLKVAATSVPAAAAVVVATPDTAEAAPVDPASDRMQDTAHTRAYLASARF